MIYEVIVSTINAEGQPHVAPFGVRYEGDLVVISPYKPSTTLANILATQRAVLNVVDDVRVFAGALTKQQDLNLVATEIVNGFRLKNVLLHKELKLQTFEDDVQRPQLFLQVVSEQYHQPFQGFNRAQAAVIELAVLVSRLHMLPKEKVLSEMAYLQIAIDKTAGERELQAWNWLIDKITNFYAEQTGDNLA
ncbi:MAG: DUF447 domain-containing protein [Methylotenera sp.]|jgi:hypothetical protein|nr:DUF447 family protein [Methylotenera sp.]HPH08344.1 DUF447 family protein [Methylotenera sp.]HPM48749.1 DUF447 family protein [Methylotenera sp.]HQM88071.1 DUF447 family protein [Methylotenera sp.]